MVYSSPRKVIALIVGRVEERSSMDLFIENASFGHVIQGSLEVKLSTIWTDERHSQEEAEPGRNSDVEKVRREKTGDAKSQKREDAGARKGRKVAKHCVFPLFCSPGGFCGPGGSKSRLVKRWVRCQLASCGAKQIWK